LSEAPLLTTITVNKNFRTAIHTDRGDLKVGFSSLTGLGKFSGGLLVIPRYRVAFNIRPSSVLMMDTHEFHGNTRITGDCISCVLYCRERITRCT
jgi:2-oxoglutarate-Fe(II)-dependent dioxygenase family protein